MKLIQTGQWYWRQDELSFKQFTLLSKVEKEEYLFLLKGLNPNELSTNDLYILRLNSTKQEIETIEHNKYKFLEL